MEKLIRKIVSDNFGAPVLNIKALGGGFYGKVFLAQIDKSPYKIIIKVYLFKDIANKEALQLKMLSNYAIAKIPKVYFVDTENQNDVLAMEYIDGINAGFQKNFPAEIKTKIAEEIVMNLLEIHSHENLAGFGDLEDEVFVKDWRDYYYDIAQNTVYKSDILHKENKIDEEIFEVIKKSFNNYHKIFYLPITRASLIHGDYNTWNILLESDMKKISGIIDPFNCRYADSEFDLYQLDNANGKELNLLELYSKKKALSENFYNKRVFYELFTEVNHYYDANRDLKTSNIDTVSKNMTDVLLKL